jgi:hypothetical protein
MGMFAWGSHIEGAMQMVKSRGKKQLRTKNGLTLFIAVRTQMVSRALQAVLFPYVDFVRLQIPRLTTSSPPPPLSLPC